MAGKLNIRDAMFDKDGVNSAPRTYYRGSMLIDTIMYSENIKIRKVSYLLSGDGSGSHQPLMVDIDEIYVFCAAGSHNIKIKAWHLNLKDPRIIAKYTKLLHKFYLKYNMYEKIFISMIFQFIWIFLIQLR